MAGQEALEAKANGAAKESEASGPGTKVRRDCLPESRESEQADRAMNPKRRGIWRPGDEASAWEDLGRRKPCEETFAPEDRGKYHRWRLPDGLTLLRAWTRDGMSEREIAAKCGVARSTFARWKQQFPEIAAALNYGPELANAEVESALHSLAVGYTKALRKTYKVKHVEYGENGRKLREYEELETGMPRELYQAAYDAAMAFIDRGGDGRPGPRTMDWTQDAPLIFPAVNRVAGFEVRAVDYLHWWTFLGYFMEIRDSTYATVLSLRQKKARGRRLEKHEKEFWQQNAEICRLKSRLTEAEAAEKARLEAILR